MKVEYDLPEAVGIQVMNEARRLAISESDYVNSALAAFAGNQTKTLVRVSSPPDEVVRDEPVGVPTGIPQGNQDLTANEIDILVKFTLGRLVTMPYEHGKQQFFTAAELIGDERWSQLTFVTRSNIGGRMYVLAKRYPSIDSTTPYGNEPRKYFNKNNQIAAAPQRA